MVELQDRLSAALHSQYEVVRELGRGGMATVYLARDLAEDREVAIKLLHPDLAAAVGGDRFRREVEIATRLKHPHILPVWSAGEAAGSLYYVMPFLRGESLRDLLDRERQLSIEQAVQLACEAAEALDYAHKHGVIHRDIKPENILLQDGHAFVADFGIARAVSGSEEKLTQTGVTLGTPTYMAPEQVFAEREIDGRADVYALGVVLYEMLAGMPPFTGPNAQAIMARHTMEQVPELAIVRQSVPDHVEDAIYRALAKTPADRFTTALEFAEALRKPGPRSGTRRTSRLTSHDRRQHKMRRVVYSAAAIVPFLLGVTGVWWYMRPKTLTADEAVAARRVAVMYFDDLSEGGRLAPVADGLTESVIEVLSQVNQLSVISRNGVEPFRGRDVPDDSIGRALRVGSVVRGTIEPTRGDSVTVTVKLVNGATGEVVGKPAKFRQAAGNVLVLRDSLPRQVAEFLRKRIGTELDLRESRVATRSVEAWTLYQRALRTRRTADSLWRVSDTTAYARSVQTADSLLTIAAALDQSWRSPTVARGQLLLMQARRSTESLRRQALVTQGLALAERALQANPRDAEALELRGSLRLFRYRANLESDPRAAKQLLADATRDLAESTKLNPTSATAWEQLSAANYEVPDFTEATFAARKAYEQDAYLANADVVLIRLYTTAYDNENFAGASDWCAEGRQRFPQHRFFVMCRLWLQSVRGAEPDVATAWKLVDSVQAITPQQEWPLQSRYARILVAGALWRAGQRDSAERVLVSARGNPEIDPDAELMTYEAAIRTMFGDKDAALEIIRQFLAANPEHREGLARSSGWWWRPLRSDPRFVRMVGGG
jgi:serine/threonine-protein kinase